MKLILFSVAMVTVSSQLPAQTPLYATVAPAVKVSWPGTSPKWFKGLQELLTSSASVKGTGSTLEFNNLRLQSEAVSFNDMVNAKFTFEPVTQGFKLASYSVARDVGVYFEPYFARDAATDFTLETGETVVHSETQYSLAISAAGAQLHGNLTTGLAPVFWFDNVTGPLFFRLVEQPEGSSAETILPKSSQALFSTPRPVVFSGKYVWEIKPVEDTSVTCQFRFHNANRTPIQTLVNGSTIWAPLSFNWEYAKCRINLNADQFLSLPKPANAKVRLTLADEKSTKLASFTGIALNYRVPQTGTYFLFIDNASGATDATYSGAVSVSN